MKKHFGYEPEKFDYTFKKKSGLTSSLPTKIKKNEWLIKARLHTPQTLPVHLECAHMPSAKKYLLAIEKIEEN